MMLNEKCKNCSMASLVTQTTNGTKLEQHEQYYQCLAMAQDECLNGEPMEIKERTKGENFTYENMYDNYKESLNQFVNIKRSEKK